MPKIVKKGAVNAGRVLRALGRIGYHPVSAVLDIADNAVSARATKIAIDIGVQKEKHAGPGRPKAVISSFTIVDNGKGMDEAALDNAIALGASDAYYEAN